MALENRLPKTEREKDLWEKFEKAIEKNTNT